YYTFGYWESDVGTFANASQSATIFTPQSTSAIGTVAGIMQDVQPNDNFWAGYLWNDANAANYNNVSCVSGSFYVEPYAYVGNRYSTDDDLSAWIGVGGYGSTPLWQAGVQVLWTATFLGGPAAVPYWEPFTESLNSTSQPPAWTGPQENGSSGSIWPNLWIVTICDSGKYPTASIELWDQNPGGKPYSQWWNETGPQWFTADTHEADWVVEDPCTSVEFTCSSGHYPIEDYSGFQIKFTNPSFTIDGSKTSCFLGPFAWLSISDGAYGNQYISPDPIRSGFQTFLETYST
ncbi:MAG TPA: hypothetical protein VK424_04005, partial [Thermoplasmata archaeon]|nr:hypothetical protein [Thermoplasmata archaeon]